MIVITHSLTVGQLTFILRAAIQVLSLAGPFLIGYIILSSATRLASFSTHDVINRIMGRLTMTKSSLQWIWGGIRQPNQRADPGRSFGLVLTVALLVLYGLFSSLSDIGFLGFYTCTTSGSSKYDRPASIKDEEAALSVIMGNFVNGGNPSNVTANRCDTSESFYDSEFLAGMRCLEWRNSTWTDRKFFSGINTTDSDMLMPLRLNTNVMNVTAFRVDTGGKRITVPTISGGILVNPAETGFQAVFGVPQLDSQQEFTLDKTMALEVETGCMTIGINTVQAADGVGSRTDVFETNRTWRSYSGPDILKDILTNYTDAIREYWLPFFNASSLDENGLYYGNGTAGLSTRSNVANADMPSNASFGAPEKTEFLGNCTNSIRERFNLPPLNRTDDQYFQCALLGLGGSMENNGAIVLGQTKMLCAAISQINMVSATVRKDVQGSISLDYTRLPSILKYHRSDFWTIVQDENDTGFLNWAPYQRYTLSDDPQGPTSHYILQNTALGVTRLAGIASAGFVLSRAGSEVILPARSRLGINILDTSDRQDLLNPKTVTRWSGEQGSALIIGSIKYNPWAALGAPQILVTSQADRLAICYDPPYILGFVPIVLAALLVLIWSVVMLIRTPYGRLSSLGDLYGGLWPYWKSVCPNVRLSDLVLIWQQDSKTSNGHGMPNELNGPNVHLEVFSSGKSVPMEKDAPMAVDYLALVSERNPNGPH